MITFFLCLSICFFAHDFEKAEFYIEKCVNVSNIVEKKDVFDTKLVENFIVDKPSDNSIIEYSEWRNELLHELIECYPKEMLTILSTLTETQKKDVYNELRTPIHDGFDYVKIKNGINSVKGYDIIKKELNDIFDSVDNRKHP